METLLISKDFFRTTAKRMKQKKKERKKTHTANMLPQL